MPIGGIRSPCSGCRRSHGGRHQIGARHADVRLVDRPAGRPHPARRPASSTGNTTRSASEMIGKAGVMRIERIGHEQPRKSRRRASYFVANCHEAPCSRALSWQRAIAPGGKLVTLESSAFRMAAANTGLSGVGAVLAGQIMKNSSRSSCRSVLLLWIAVLALGLSAWSLPATAQTEAQSTTPVDPDPWRFNAAAYGWVLNIGGSVTARGQTVDTNASTIDLFQKSQSLGGLMAYFEADKGKAG